MAIAARLYRDERWAERHRLERDATLRDSEWTPLDAVVEDVSSGGFRVAAGAELAIDSEVGLGLAGMGVRQARVVRRAGDGYGCEFLTALTAAELQAALQAIVAAPIALPVDGKAPAETFEASFDAAADGDAVARLPILGRALIIATGAIASWGVVIGGGWALARLALPVLAIR